VRDATAAGAGSGSRHGALAAREAVLDAAATRAGGVHQGGAAAAARDAAADVVRRRPAQATAIVVARRWTRGRSTPVRRRPEGFG